MVRTSSHWRVSSRDEGRSTGRSDRGPTGEQNAEVQATDYAHSERQRKGQGQDEIEGAIDDDSASFDFYNSTTVYAGPGDSSAESNEKLATWLRHEHVAAAWRNVIRGRRMIWGLLCPVRERGGSICIKL
eukprot:6482049-Amphidinium_carterae.1